MSDIPDFSIVVINWNGEEFIVRTISSLLLSARMTGKPFELIVIDDASSDNSVDLIEHTFPHIQVVRNKDNVGFIQSVRHGVDAACAELVFLLNNDIAVRETFIANMRAYFDSQDSGLFAVTAKTVNWHDGTPNHLWMSARFEKGMFVLTFDDPKHARPTLFGQGGSMLFRKSVFIELGGFKEIFHPGYWEDYDLCYLATKCGYTVFYAPDALAYHLGSASLTRALGKEGVYNLRERNMLLFTWLNLTDLKLALRHFLSLPFSIIMRWMTHKDAALFKGFFRSLPYIVTVLRYRRSVSKRIVLSDAQVLKRCQQNEEGKINEK